MKAKILACTVITSMMFSTAANAVQPVVDFDSIAQAKLQLAELKEQVTQLTEQTQLLADAKAELESQLAAFGEMGALNIPTLNFSKIAGQLNSNMSCLVPDYQNLMPSIGETEIDLGSVCTRGDVYKKGLVVNRQESKKLSAQERRELTAATRKQREKTTTDATTKGLSHADMAIEHSMETVKAAQELKISARQAETVNDRLQVISETNIAILQGQAVNTQLLAQMLRVVSALGVEMAVPIESDLALERDN